MSTGHPISVDLFYMWWYSLSTVTFLLLRDSFLCLPLSPTCLKKPPFLCILTEEEQDKEREWWDRTGEGREWRRGGSWASECNKQTVCSKSSKRTECVAKYIRRTAPLRVASCHYQSINGCTESTMTTVKMIVNSSNGDNHKVYAYQLRMVKEEEKTKKRLDKQKANILFITVSI